MFVRGSNLGAMDNMLRFEEERYLGYLDQIEDANIRLLRVWAGGVQETETFYKICDRKGSCAGGRLVFLFQVPGIAWTVHATP